MKVVALATALLLSADPAPAVAQATKTEPPKQEPAKSDPARGDVVAQTRAWHQTRLQRLTSEDGWLSLVGLHWLRQGDNVVGSKAKLKLPDSVPAEVGVFKLKGKEVTFLPSRDVKVTLKGEPFPGGPIKTDVKGDPDELQVGSVKFFVLQRGDRIGIRVKDSEASARKNFKGIELFQPSEKWRIEATLIESPGSVKVASVAVPTVIGSVEEMKSPGKVHFQIDGKDYELTAVTEEGSDKLFIIFGDETNKTESYGAGRFLYADAPKNGKVLLDFNKSYNPPCAFSAYATCPLPPKGNKLAVRIEAGEKRYDGKH